MIAAVPQRVMIRSYKVDSDWSTFGAAVERRALIGLCMLLLLHPSILSVCFS